jgi:hypothetical protein
MSQYSEVILNLPATILVAYILPICLGFVQLCYNSQLKHVHECILTENNFTNFMGIIGINLSQID